MHDTAVTQLFCLITTVAQHTIHIAFTFTSCASVAGAHTYGLRLSAKELCCDHLIFTFFQIQL